MFKKLLGVLFFFSIFTNAQHTIKGSMQPAKDYTWVALYKLQGAQQDYIGNSLITDGAFTLTITGEKTPGIYRIVYDLENRLYVDLIYNKEDISVNFHPLFPSKIIKFQQSFENNIYQNYKKAIALPQQKLDSLQVAYFSTPSPELNSIYQKSHAELRAIQKQYEQLSEGKLANHFIKASLRYNSESLIATPSIYLASVKSHFFDAVDFNKPELLNSAFINDKINDFIFYLNSSEDPETLTQLRKTAITEVLAKVSDNYTLAKDVEEGLLYTFAQREDISMVNYVLNYYIQLPKETQDIPFINDIKAQLRTAVGMKVPALSWQENDTDISLESLKSHPYYLVVFWSSTCSHCLKEMPLLYENLKENPRVKVIAVGLEDTTSKSGWETQIASYPNFINIYGDGKWENKFARDYGVNATPSFFLLDHSKKILAKPDDAEAVQLFLDSNASQK